MSADVDTAPGAVLLTVTEACARLRISRWLLYRLIQRNELRTITIGSRRLVPVGEIEAFIAARRQAGTL